MQSLRGALEERFGFDTIQGRSPAFTTALGQAKKVAPTDTTVLLTGASGTGKAVLARRTEAGRPGPVTGARPIRSAQDALAEENLAHP